MIEADKARVGSWFWGNVVMGGGVASRGRGGQMGEATIGTRDQTLPSRSQRTWQGQDWKRA